MLPGIAEVVQIATGTAAVTQYVAQLRLVGIEERPLVIVLRISVRL